MSGTGWNAERTTEHRHLWLDTTTLSDHQAHYPCATCPAKKTEPKWQPNVCDCYCRTCETDRGQCCKDQT